MNLKGKYSSMTCLALAERKRSQRLGSAMHSSEPRQCGAEIPSSGAKDQDGGAWWGLRQCFAQVSSRELHILGAQSFCSIGCHGGWQAVRPAQRAC